MRAGGKLTNKCQWLSNSVDRWVLTRYLKAVTLECDWRSLWSWSLTVSFSITPTPPPTPNSLCSQDSLPVTYQACVMTRDCEVSGWSEWSACSKQCYDLNGPKGERVRTRRVSQFTVGHDGAECPELEEKEACSPGDGAPPCTV